MSRARKLALNALSLLVANILSKVILFAGSIFLLQFLNPTLESTYYLVTAFALLATANFQDGMTQISIRRIATDRENGPYHLATLFYASFLLAIVLMIVAVPVLMVYSAREFGDQAERIHFQLSAIGLMGAYLIGYGYAASGAGFKAYEKLYLESILLVIQAVLNAFVYWYGAQHHWPLEFFFYGLFATNAFHSLISYIVLATFVAKPRFKFSIADIWSVFKESLPLGYATLLRTLQDRIHVFFITGILGFSLNTQFASPNNFLTQFKFIPMSIRPALFPTLARKAECETDELQVYSTALAKFLFLIALPLMIMLTIARREVLPLFTEMGPSFEEIYGNAVEVFPLVAFAVALSFPSQVMRNVFVAIRRPQYEFRTVLAGVAVLATLDYILIGRMGIIGAGWASVAGELVILSSGLWLLRRIGRPLNEMRVFLLPMVCGIMTYLAAGFLYTVHWALGLLAVMLIYPALLLAMRIISPVEWSILKEIAGLKRA